MVGKIPEATDALLRTILACLERATRVTEARPGWRFEDLFRSRVNVYLFQVTEDRLAANDALPSRPEQRPVTLSYLVTFYGKGAGGNAELVIERLAKSAALDVAAGVSISSGLFARVNETDNEEMAVIWGMFRRKYALSMVVDVKGTVLG
jgi:hypothetical protein